MKGQSSPWTARLFRSRLLIAGVISDAGSLETETEFDGSRVKPKEEDTNVKECIDMEQQHWLLCILFFSRPRRTLLKCFAVLCSIALLHLLIPTHEDITPKQSETLELSRIQMDVIHNVDEIETISMISSPIVEYPQAMRVLKTINTERKQVEPPNVGYYQKLKPPQPKKLNYPKSLIYINRTAIIEDGIYWAEELERKVPVGLDDGEMNIKLKQLRDLKIEYMSWPEVHSCGRGNSAQLRMSDGSKLCARYGNVCLVLGELLSFYLSRYLGMDNVPLVILSRPDPETEMWSAPEIRRRLRGRRWKSDRLVALIEWKPYLNKSITLPKVFLKGSKLLYAHHPLIYGMSDIDLLHLLQWTDVILFDYLTAHLDRLISIYKGRRKISGKIGTRNLGVSEGKKFWLLDNQTGFIWAYQLTSPSYRDSDLLLRHQEEILNSTCVFRRSTVNKITELYYSTKPFAHIRRAVHFHEPLAELNNSQAIPDCDDNALEIDEIFHERINRAYKRIQQCKEMYGHR